MEVLKAKTFFIRGIDYSENDRIVVLYTRERGKVSALAKQALKSKQRFGFNLQAFRLFEAELRFKPHQDLAFLQSCSPLLSFQKFHHDLALIACGYRLLELVDCFEQENQASPETFDALQEAFTSLESGADLLKTRLIFEAKLLALAGLAPSCQACLVCEKPVPFGGAELNLSHGGLVCGQCHLDGKTLAISEQALPCLLGLFSPSRFQHGANDEVAGLLENFILHQLGHPLKTSLFEKSIQIHD